MKTHTHCSNSHIEAASVQGIIVWFNFSDTLWCNFKRLGAARDSCAAVAFSFVAAHQVQVDIHQEQNAEAIQVHIEALKINNKTIILEFLIDRSMIFSVNDEISTNFNSILRITHY